MSMMRPVMVFSADIPFRIICWVGNTCQVFKQNLVFWVLRRLGVDLGTLTALHRLGHPWECVCRPRWSHLYAVKTRTWLGYKNVIRAARYECRRAQEAKAMAALPVCLRRKCFRHSAYFSAWRKSGLLAHTTALSCSWQAPCLQFGTCLVLSR